MTNKYPSKKPPYQYVRQAPPTCCTTRLGLTKKRFKTEAEATAKMSKYDGSYSVYPCQQGSGFHIRTNRGRTNESY